MLLRQFRLGNNLPTHNKENTDFSQQKPRQLPSAEANFKGCEQYRNGCLWDFRFKKHLGGKQSF